MFILEIFKNILLPSNLALIFLCFSLAFTAARKFRLSLYLSSIGTLVLIVFSNGIVAATLLSSLEYSYQPVSNEVSTYNSTNIVVLTAYASPDENMPLSSRVNSHSAHRILEALYIYERCKRCRLIVSGEKQAAHIFRDMLLGLGVDPSSLILDDLSPHTYNSAKNLFQIISRQNFFLVTSAGHMPRALGVFKRLNMNPIPAPTDYSLSKDPLKSSMLFKPAFLKYSDSAVNEYLGLAWYRLTGKI